MILADHLEPVFDGNFIAARNAAKTLVVIFEGTNSIGNEWGLGVRVQLTTTRGVVTKPKKAHWAINGNSIVGHSKQALLVFLEPFGYTWDDVEKAVTRPNVHHKLEMTLPELLGKLQAA